MDQLQRLSLRDVNQVTKELPGIIQWAIRDMTAPNYQPKMPASNRGHSQESAPENNGIAQREKNQSSVMADWVIAPLEFEGLSLPNQERI